MSKERYGWDDKVLRIVLIAFSLIAAYGISTNLYSLSASLAIAGGIGLLVSLTAYAVNQVKLPTVILNEELEQ